MIKVIYSTGLIKLNLKKHKVMTINPPYKKTGLIATALTDYKL